MLKYIPKKDIEVDSKVNSEKINSEKDSDSFSKYDSIENMISEMKTPREDVNADKKPVVDETVIEDAPELKEPESIPITNTPVAEFAKTKISDRKARMEAKFLARTTDNINAIACSFIADEDPDDFGADEDELNDIMEYYYEWRCESSEPIPPIIEMIVGIGFIYAPKYKQAFKLRKEKKKNAILEIEKNEMQQTIQHLLEKIQHIESIKEVA